MTSARDRSGLPVVYDAPTAGLHGAVHDPRRLRSPKLSELIAADVVRDIVAGRFAIGDHLAPESTMLAQYDVGRESLREALRLLETQGLITIKRGPGGGPVVAGVDPRYLARTTALYFHLNGATYDEVIEAWQVLEPALAAQLARLPSRAEVRRVLTPYLPPTRDSDTEPAESEVSCLDGNGFHPALAQLSGSRVMVLLLRALSVMVVDHVAESLDPLEEWEGCGLEHGAIAQAIIDGRPVKAHRLMSEHIGLLRESSNRRWPDRMLDLVEWP